MLCIFIRVHIRIRIYLSCEQKWVQEIQLTIIFKNAWPQIKIHAKVRLIFLAYHDWIFELLSS